ncbi:MAG: hypothetical protein WAK33_20260 [Silvibacterium sp.]
MTDPLPQRICHFFAPNNQEQLVHLNSGLALRQYHQRTSPLRGSAAKWLDFQNDFRFCFAYAVFMFQGPSTYLAFVIRCKGCGENIPAPVETLPSSWIAAKCPLCGEHRRYLPNEIFQGRVSYEVTKLKGSRVRP